MSMEHALAQDSDGGLLTRQLWSNVQLVVSYTPVPASQFLTHVPCSRSFHPLNIPPGVS